jgi:putative acetyltransferase
MVTYYTGQSRPIAEIFYRAIHELAIVAYSPEQVEAWAPTPVNYDHWRWRCEMKRPFVYLVKAQVRGFIELDPDGHIDCHYVHPEFNRQGIGAALLQHALEVARHMGRPTAYVEASHIAKGLYLKNGFEVVRPNEVTCRGVTLQNWIMEKSLR